MQRKKFTRITAAILSALMCVLSLQIYVTAEASVTEENSVAVAYVSTSGSVTYGGQTYEAFTGFDEAIAALGENGGIIRFSGIVPLGVNGPFIIDVAGRKALTIVGVDEDYSKDVIEFPDKYGNISLLGDTTFDNLTFKVIAGKELPILPNGHTLTMGEKIGVTRFVPEGQTDLTRSLHIYGVANAEGAPADTVIINGGIYTRISGGSYWDTVGNKKIVGDVSYTINGGTFMSIVGGFANASPTSGEQNILEGNIRFVINGGDFMSNIYTGSTASGHIKGNSVFEINGGNFSSNLNLLAANSTDKSIFEGNSAIIINGGILNGAVLGTVGHGNIDGKEIYIINDASCGASFSADSTADYRITCVGGKVYPKFNGTTLEGFIITSDRTAGVLEVYANGEQITPISGNLYQLPQGKVDISIGYSGGMTIKNEGAFIRGYEDGTFRPQNNMTRAEAVTTLLRLLTDESAIKGKFTTTFSDVNPGDWYYDNIAMFEAVGFLSSYKDTFSPNQYITRAEFVELIYKISETKSILFGAFSDVPSSHPRYLAISSAASSGLVTGYPDGTFLPEGNITRAEVVTVIDRLLKREPTGNAGLNDFNDISDHWAKNNIIAASNDSIQSIDGADTQIWKEAQSQKTSFVLPEGATSGEMIKALSDQKNSLTADSYLEGVDKIAETMKNNVINSKSEYEAKGTIYYVSNQGNDSNDGTSPDKAWATLTKVAWAPLTAGDVVLFERGGEWRGQVPTREGVTYSAYGEGNKPVFMGSARNYADESLWQTTEYPNVYVCTELITNAGFFAPDHSKEYNKNDEIMGVMKIKGAGGFNSEADLKNDLEFYSDLATNKFYVYSAEGNPGKRYQSIEIGANVYTFTCSTTDVTIDNVHVKFTGGHGVGAGKVYNLTVRNSIFSYLGGSILKGFNGGNTTRFGNAVQVYGACDGYHVYNNYIYQIYDTAMTHQNSSSSNGACEMIDVDYVSNIAEYCHWTVEYYNQASADGAKKTMRDVNVSDNVFRFGGYGWGSVPRQSGAALFNSFGVPDDLSDFIVKNNIFDRSKGMLVRLQTNGDKNIEFDSNVFIAVKDKPFGLLYSKNYYMNNGVISTLEDFIGAKNSTVMLVSEK